MASAGFRKSTSVYSLWSTWTISRPL